DEHSADEQRGLDDEGAWLFNLSAEYQHEVQPVQTHYFKEYKTELTVTDPQNHALRESLDSTNEYLDLKGYAFSDITHLLSRFAERLNPQRTLLIAQTGGQLQALKNRAGQHFPAMTFAQAVAQVLDSNLLSNSWRLTDRARGQYTWQVAHAQAAQWLNLPSIGALSPAQVASVSQRTVASFCYSTAAQIDVVHLPAGIAQQLSELDRAVLLEAVNQ